MNLWKSVAAVVLILLIVLPEIILGYVVAKWDSAKKQTKEDAEKAERDKKYQDFVQQIKDEVKEDAEKRKEKLNGGDAGSRFSAADSIMRNKN